MYSDVKTLQLMSAVTKSCGQLQELISDFKVQQKAEQRRGGGMGGRFGGMGMGGFGI